MSKKTKSPGRKGYSPAMKAKVLAAAKRDKLTGAQVAKRFGISTLTFYRWRGPVRSHAVTRKVDKRGPGRPKGSKDRMVAGTGIGNGLVREQVRTEVRRVIPEVIRQEVEAYLRRLLS
jgi:transposase-like protein